MAESVFEFSDYPVYNPNYMTLVNEQYTARVPGSGTCSLGFYVPLSELPAGYQNAVFEVGGLVSPPLIAKTFGFQTMTGFVPNGGAFGNDWVYTQGGDEYLVPTVLCMNLNKTLPQTVKISPLFLRVTVDGQVPVRLGSNGIKGVRLGETPVVGLRLGETKLL